MSKRNNQGQKASLARAIAGGATVKGWAATHKVNTRTAYKWSASREVRDQVATIHRRVMARAIGRYARHATGTADRVATLAKSAESEAVRLAANRALLADLLSLMDHQQFEDRLAALEAAATNPQPPNP